MAATHAPRRTFSDYDLMLSDPDVEAVIIATADAFHVDASIRALEAGKHVLCEKPMAGSVEEAERLRDAAARSGRVLHIGHMKRYDGGIEAAKDFIDREMGEVLSLKAWYCDSTHRYVMTDAVQPAIVKSAASRRPSGDPKADRERYLMLAHGSHLVDIARFLAAKSRLFTHGYASALVPAAGSLTSAFAVAPSATSTSPSPSAWIGTRASRFRASMAASSRRPINPWYFKSSEVEIFRERDATWYRPLAADGHFYRRQVEGFADAVLTGRPARGATAEDGVASVRAMVAIAQSVREGRPVVLAEATGLV